MASHNKRSIVDIPQVTNQTPPTSPPLPSSSVALQQQQQQVTRQSHVGTARSSAAFVFVPRYVGLDESDDDDDDDEEDGAAAAAAAGGDNVDGFAVQRCVPRTPPGNCRDEERVFLVEFQECIIALLRDLRRHFPYRQKIEWTIEYGDNKEHTFHILIKSPRSTRGRD